MYTYSTMLTFGAALLLSLFCVDGGYAFQIVNGKPPVDFMTVATMNGWTEGPMQVIGILLGTGLIVLVGRSIRRMMVRRHHHYGHQT
jgi:hypothetical protein